MDEAFSHFNETATRGNIIGVVENHMISYRNGPRLMT